MEVVVVAVVVIPGVVRDRVEALSDSLGVTCAGMCWAVNGECGLRVIGVLSGRQGGESVNGGVLGGKGWRHCLMQGGGGQSNAVASGEEVCVVV